MTRLLVAMDDSAESVAVAKAAAAMFATPDTEILLINVVRVPVLSTTGKEFGDVAVAAQPERWEAETQRRELQAAAMTAGIPRAQVLVKIGDPVEVICRAAEEHNVDVVVIGRHSKGLLARLVNPPTSERVLHHTERAVLVITGKKTRRALTSEGVLE